MKGPHTAHDSTSPIVLVTLLVIMLALASCTTDSDGERNPDPLDATLRIDIDHCGALAHSEATGVLVSLGDDLFIATVAHAFVDANRTVAGGKDSGETVTNGSAVTAEEITVHQQQGPTLTATIVFLDAATDIALLAVGGPSDTGLEFADYDGESTARLVVYADGATAPSIQQIDVVGATRATLDGEDERDALELSADIQPGDSGAPVLNDDGQVIGVVFASSRTSESSWAIASAEFTNAMAQPSEPVRVACP
ncbi:MAG: S1-C subfamily serine protease [Acidimicrobiales bacterium]|jgi:S1-C subfamily serine protease